MEKAGESTEQRQLLVEVEAVTANIGRQRDPQTASYEVEQGRKLIEKAISLGLPKESYAKLRDCIAAHDGRNGGS